MAKKNTPAKPTKAPRDKKQAKSGGREVFEKVGHKDEKVYPFSKAVPEGFDFKTNKVLKKKDFTADSLYFEHRALEMEYRAELFRTQAEEAKKMGSAKDRGRAKRLIKLQEKMDELKKHLKEHNVDVDALLKNAVKEAETE